MYPYHFFVLAPPLALLFAMIRARIVFSPLPRLRAAVLLSDYGAWRFVSNYHAPRSRLAASDFFQSHAAPREVVWGDYMMRLLVETDLTPGSRFAVTFIWANDDEAPQEYLAEMLADFEQRRPKFILLPTEINRHIEENDPDQGKPELITIPP